MRTLTQIREAGGPAADLKPNDEQDNERQDKGEPRAKGEKKFKDQHKVDTKKHPVASDAQHDGGSKFGGEHEKHEGQNEPVQKQGSSDTKGSTKDGSAKADTSKAARKRVGDLLTVNQGSSKVAEGFINEGIMEDIAKIAKQKQAKRIRFSNGKTEMVDSFTASAISQVYEKVNKQNQAKMEKMATTLPGFMKLMDFAMSKAGGK
jgi:hypothetical protein